MFRESQSHCLYESLVPMDPQLPLFEVRGPAAPASFSAAGNTLFPDISPGFADTLMVPNCSLRGGVSCPCLAADVVWSVSG